MSGSQLPILSRYPPRAVRPTTWAVGLRWLFLALVVATAIGGGLIGANEVRKTDSLAKAGEVAQGTVTEHYRRSGKNKSRKVAYQFQVEGRTYGRTVDVSRDAYERLAVGSQVEVTYLPAGPELNRLGRVGPEDVQRTQTGWLAGTVALSALWLLLAAFVELAWRAQAAVLKFGTVIEGRVTKSERKSNGKNSWTRVTYTYRHPNQGDVEAKVDLSTSSAKAIEAGDPFQILFREDVAKGKPLAVQAINMAKLDDRI